MEKGREKKLAITALEIETGGVVLHCRQEAPPPSDLGCWNEKPAAASPRRLMSALSMMQL